MINELKSKQTILLNKLIGNILIVNHKEAQCGIQQFGNILSNILIKSTKYNFFYKEISNHDEFLICYNELHPELIIFNYSPATLPWLNLSNLPQNNKNIFIVHEIDHFKNFENLIKIHIDPDYQEDETNFRINRLIIPFDQPLSNTPPNNIIGSFGFGFSDKGFSRIIEYTNNEFDNAIIRLHLPASYFGDREGINSKQIAAECVKLAKPEIKLEINHDFLSVNDLLLWLSKNTINVFLYEDKPGQGVSSVIDFALAVKRPIAISNSRMFRHISNPDILLDPSSPNTLKSIIAKGFSPLQKYYEKWNDSNMLSNFEAILDKLI